MNPSLPWFEYLVHASENKALPAVYPFIENNISPVTNHNLAIIEFFEDLSPLFALLCVPLCKASPAS